MGRRLAVVMILLFAAAAMAGCAELPKMTGPAAPSCSAKAKYEIAYQAEVVKVDCLIKKYKGVPSLYFEVTLKNTGAQAYRYRVNIFLPNGKAVGGLVPRKGKPPVVKPGQVVTVKYPFKGLATKPKSFELIVKTLGN